MYCVWYFFFFAVPNVLGKCLISLPARFTTLMQRLLLFILLSNTNIEAFILASDKVSKFCLS